VVIPKLRTGLFPDAPVIEELPEGNDTVFAASVIRASRKLTQEHNVRKDDTVAAANEAIQGAAKDYNESLEKRRIECREVTKPEPEKPKRRKRLGLF